MLPSRKPRIHQDRNICTSPIEHLRACSGIQIGGSGAEYEARTNRLAHLLRARGLGRLDHYAIFMENNGRYLEACGAGERAGPA